MAVAATAKARKDVATVAERSAPGHEGAAVFAAKLRVPAAALAFVDRSRLSPSLDEGVAAGVLVLAAPAGYGKTQLVADWTRSAGHRDVAWVTLDEADRDPARFLRHVIAALGRSEAGARALAPLLAQPLIAAVTEAHLMVVTEALEALEDSIVLALDDFHEVVGSASEDLTRALVQYRPDALRLVVMTRVEPDLGQAGLRLRGLVRELGARELAFTTEESHEVLEAHGVSLHDEALAAVQRMTAGWPTGISLVAHALVGAGTSDVDATIAAFATGRGSVGDYLLVEVVEKQPPELQRFLLRAAIANPVCGRLADALTGGRGGEITLSELYRQRLFIERLDLAGDEQCRWYSWHPLFAAVLRSRLYDIDGDDAIALQRTAARWFKSKGLPVQGVRHAAAAGDLELAASMVGDAWLDLTVTGDGDGLTRLLDVFDVSQKTANAELAAACAYANLLARDLPGAARAAERALELAPHLEGGRRRSVEVVAAAVRVATATMTGGDDLGAYADANAVLAGLPAESTTFSRPERARRALLLYHLGTFAASRRCDDTARDHLHDALVEATPLGLDHLVLRARAQLAVVDLSTTKLDRAEIRSRSVLDPSTSGGRSSGEAITRFVLGGVQSLRGETVEGLRNLEVARSQIHPVDTANKFNLGVTIHAALVAADRVEDARAELDRLAGQAEEWGAPRRVRRALVLATAQQLVVEQRGEEALRLLATGLASAAPGPSPPPAPDIEAIVLRAQALLSVNRADEAAAVLEGIDATAATRVLQVRVLVTAAAVAAHRGRRDEALHSLGQALEAAREGPLVQPFLLVNAPVRPMLEALLQDGTPLEAEALAVLARLPAAPNTGPSPFVVVEPLTSRELEVLRRLQGTAPNEEVAARLFISANTLRTHLKHIHRKLGTTNRREAVARARAVGLL